jgi:Glutathione S-transferase
MIQFFDLAGARDDQRLSPYCWRTRLALEHKGLSYDAIAWRFTEKDLIAFTGQGACPVIVDNGKAVHDSWAIMEYLEATYPAHPFFDSPQAKAHALFIKHWTEQVLHVGLTKQVVLDVHDMLADRDKPHFRSTREQRLGMTLEAFSADRDAVLPAFRAALSPLRTPCRKSLLSAASGRLTPIISSLAGSNGRGQLRARCARTERSDLRLARVNAGPVRRPPGQDAGARRGFREVTFAQPI